MKYTSSILKTFFFFSVLHLGFLPVAHAKAQHDNQTKILPTLIKSSLSRFSNARNKQIIISYLKKAQKISEGEISKALSYLDRLQFQDNDGCVLCAKMTIENKEHVFNLYEVNERSIKGSIDGKTFHFNKKNPFSPKKLTNISRGQLHTYRHLFLNDAHADLFMLAVMLGTFIVIAAAMITSLLFEAGLEWLIKQKIGGDFCCELVENAKKKGYELQDHSSACILDMHRTFNSDTSVSLESLEDLRTFREMENIYSDFHELEELSENEREYILDNTQRLIDTCSEEEPIFKDSRGYVVEDIKNNPNCVKEYQSSTQLISDAAENGKVLRQCLDLAKSVRGEKKYGIRSRESSEAPIRKINETDRNRLNDIKKQNSAIKTFFRSVDK